MNVKILETAKALSWISAEWIKLPSIVTPDVFVEANSSVV